MLDIKKIESNILFLKRVIFKIWLFLIIFELAIFPSLATLYALLLCSVGLLLCGKFVFNTRCLLLYSVSSITILMYTAFFMLLPTIATLIEFKPLIYNLRDPFQTFTQLLIIQAALITIHLLYRKLSRRFVLKKHLYKMVFFNKLSYQELWATILISLVSYIYIILSYGLYNENGENSASDIPILLRIIGFIMGSAYSIVLIFYMKKFDVIKRQYEPNNKLIILVVVMAFVTGLATNMRTNAISCFSAGLFLFVVYDLFYPLNLKQIFTVKNILIYGFMAYFFTGPFMDISTAMLLSRGDRNGKSGIEVLTETMSNINIKDDTDNYLNKNTLNWDEEYLSNHILNRFCSLKILDETLFHADRVGFNNPIMRETLHEKVIDSFPGIIKKFLKVEDDKTLRQYSLTDKLYSLSVSGAGLGGLKIGTLQGLGLSLWGWGYLLVLIPIYLVLFYLLDATVLFYKGRIKFSLFFIFNVSTFVYWFSDKHYYQWEFRWIFRNYWESLFFFILFLFIIKRIPFIKH